MSMGRTFIFACKFMLVLRSLGHSILISVWSILYPILLYFVQSLLHHQAYKTTNVIIATIDDPGTRFVFYSCKQKLYIFYIYLYFIYILYLQENNSAKYKSFSWVTLLRPFLFCVLKFASAYKILMCLDNFKLLKICD